MTAWYQLIGTYLFEEDVGWYHTYGIKVILPDGTSRTLSDISTDRERVQALVDACRAGALDPDHLTDVVENFLP